MDQEVAQTLAALERKLAELERELTAIGRDNAPPATTTPAITPASDIMPSSGMLVDEAVEQRFSMEARETVYGEIPATKDRRQSIDLADLVRFKEEMQSTLQGLIDEYSRLLSLQPPSESPSRRETP